MLTEKDKQLNSYIHKIHKDKLPERAKNSLCSFLWKLREKGETVEKLEDLAGIYKYKMREVNGLGKKSYHDIIRYLDSVGIYMLPKTETEKTPEVEVLIDDGKSLTVRMNILDFFLDVMEEMHNQQVKLLKEEKEISIEGNGYLFELEIKMTRKDF